MADAGSTLARWAEAVIAAELPIEEGRYALALTRPDAELRAEHRGAAWSGSVCCDGRALGASLRLTGVARRYDPASPITPTSHDALVWLFSVERMGDRTRAAAFVRGWAVALRKVFRDLTQNPFPDAPWFGTADLGAPHVHDRLLERHDTVEGFVSALTDPKALGRFFAPPIDAARAALDRVHDVVMESPPLLDARGVVLRALATPWNDEAPVGPFRGGVRVRHAGVVVGLELAVSEEGVLRDLKQQEVDMVPSTAFGDLDRVEACLRAWRDVLPDHVALMEPVGLDAMMPHDLVLSDALAMKRPRTREDFRKVFERRWHFDERRAQRASPRRR